MRFFVTYFMYAIINFLFVTIYAAYEIYVNICISSIIKFLSYKWMFRITGKCRARNNFYHFAAAP